MFSREKGYKIRVKVHGKGGISAPNRRAWLPPLNHCLMPLTLFWGQGHRSGSRSGVEVKVTGQVQRSNAWCVAVDIRGSICRMQQKAIILKFFSFETGEGMTKVNHNTDYFKGQNC